MPGRLRTVAIETQAGSSIRGSSEAPERYKTQEVIYAIKKFVVKSRTAAADGV